MQREFGDVRVGLNALTQTGQQAIHERFAVVAFVDANLRRLFGLAPPRAGR